MKFTEMISVSFLCNPQAQSDSANHHSSGSLASSEDASESQSIAVSACSQLIPKVKLGKHPRESNKKDKPRRPNNPSGPINGVPSQQQQLDPGLRAALSHNSSRDSGLVRHPRAPPRFQQANHVIANLGGGGYYAQGPAHSPQKGHKATPHQKKCDERIRKLVSVRDKAMCVCVWGGGYHMWVFGWFGVYKHSGDIPCVYICLYGKESD